MEENSIPKITTDILLSLSIVGLLIITCVVYWPALPGNLMLDDIQILAALNNMGGVTSQTSLAHFLGDGVGVLGRPISMLSFLIDDQYFPGDPAKYRYTNLMIHLLCGLFILLFTNKLLSFLHTENGHRDFISILVFAFWLLHPLNVSTTAYIVQRMTQLMTLFTLVGLVSYVYGRSILPSKQKPGAAYITASLIPFSILAFLSKENGALICLYIFAIELTVLRNINKPHWFKYWFGILIITPLILLLLYLVFNFSSFLKAYEYRDFTLLERLLTESRILISYLYQIIIPPSGNTGIYHDDIEISTSLVSPTTTLASVILVITLIVLAFRLRKTQPVFSLATFWFFGGHIIESTIMPLELYFEHRNYLPMLGPIVGVVYYCYYFASKMGSPNHKRLVYSVPMLLILASTVFTHQSTILWGNPELMNKVWYEEHPNSLRAATMYAQTLEKNKNYNQAIKVLETTYQNHSDTVALLLYLLKLSCQSNTPPEHDVSDIIVASNDAVYRGLLPTVTRELIRTIKTTNCRYLNTDDLISIILALENMNRLRGTTKAQMIITLSDLYIEKGQLSPAVESLDRAFKAAKLPTIAVKQAELLVSAGLYNDALRFIDKAKVADSKRQFHKASHAPLIKAMEKYIHSQIDKKTAQSHEKQH